MAAHQERVLGDLAALEKRLWAYMERQQQRALDTLDDLEKKAAALGGEAPQVGKFRKGAAQADEKGSKDKNSEIPWSAGHYHYTDCPHDTQEKYRDNSCRCGARAAQHTAALNQLAQRSKGRVRAEVSPSPSPAASSSVASPAVTEKSAEAKLSTPWRELADRQCGVLVSLDALEARAWNILQRQRQEQVRQVEALGRRHDALEAALAAAAGETSSKAGAQGEQRQQKKGKHGQQNAGSQERGVSKRGQQGKQGKGDRSREAAATAVPLARGPEDGFTPFDNSRFASNVVHHLVLQGLPVIQQQFPSTVAAEPYKIVAWKQIESSKHKGINYLVQMAYQGGTVLQLQLNRPAADHGAVSVISGALTPIGPSDESSACGAASSTSVKDSKKAQEQLAAKQGLVASFAVAPSDYYSWSLEQRRALLKANSVNHLFKSVIMHNSKADHKNFADPLFSKYYMIIVQYTAVTNNEKLINAFRKMTQEKTGKPIARKKINFRLVPEDVSAKLSGFGHNAVSPLGMVSKIPIVLTHEALKLEYMWLGGGHVDLKMRVNVKDFVDHFKPLIIDFTNPRTDA